MDAKNARMSIPAVAGLAIGIALVTSFALSMKPSPFVPDSAPSIIVPKNADVKTPAEDFDVVYSTDRVDIAPVLDTKNDVFVKDMVCDPDVQVKLELSDAELQGIWQSIIENDFFRIPPDLTERCELYGNCVVMTPSYTAILNVTAYGQNHAVKYSSASMPLNDKYVRHYQQIQGTIWSILTDREEVKELPKPRCGYQ